MVGEFYKRQPTAESRGAKSRLKFQRDVGPLQERGVDGPGGGGEPGRHAGTLGAAPGRGRAGTRL